jgi:hypothetical protein
MQHVPVLAVFVDDERFAVALDKMPDAIERTAFDNTSQGVEKLLAWIDETLDEEAEIDWIATVPQGEGGAVFKWLYEEVPELFLQNPGSLKEFARRNNLPWDQAETLLAFHRSKVW